MKVSQWLQSLDPKMRAVWLHEVRLSGRGEKQTLSLKKEDAYAALQQNEDTCNCVGNIACRPMPGYSIIWGIHWNSEDECWCPQCLFLVAAKKQSVADVTPVLCKAPAPSVPAPAPHVGESDAPPVGESDAPPVGESEDTDRPDDPLKKDLMKMMDEAVDALDGESASDVN